MAKLSFLDDEDDADLNLPLHPPQTSKFKPRKSKLNFKAKSTDMASRSKQQLLVVSDDEIEEDLNILPKKNITLKRKIDDTLDNNLRNNLVTDYENTGKKSDIQDYLKSYGDNTTFLDKEKLEDVGTDAEVEGFIIEGKDLENNSDDEINLLRQNDLKINTFRETQKTVETSTEKQENVKRRKEIEEALYHTNLNDIVADADNDNSDNDLNQTPHSDDKYTIDFASSAHNVSELDIFNIVDYDGESFDLREIEPSIDLPNLTLKKTQLEFHSIAPFDETVKATEEKIGSLTDIIAKRELQMSHLKAEHDKLVEKNKEYATRMSQALCHCR